MLEFFLKTLAFADEIDLARPKTNTKAANFTIEVYLWFDK